MSSLKRHLETKLMLLHQDLELQFTAHTPKIVKKNQLIKAIKTQQHTLSSL